MSSETDDVAVNILRETLKKNEDVMTTGLFHKNSSPLHHNSFENTFGCSCGFYKINTIFQFRNIN